MRSLPPCWRSGPPSPSIPRATWCARPSRLLPGARPSGWGRCVLTALRLHHRIGPSSYQPVLLSREDDIYFVALYCVFDSHVFNLEPDLIGPVLYPEMEFLNPFLTKGKYLLHYATHNHFHWRILLPPVVFSDSSFLQQQLGGGGGVSCFLTKKIRSRIPPLIQDGKG